MGYTSNTTTESHTKTRKVFLYINYTLLGAAASCIFLTLSLRLIPSLYGFLFICLHVTTILGALAGCTAVSGGSHPWYYYASHMTATVLTAIFQGSISVLIFTGAVDFLHKLRSYVRDDEGVKILKLAGGLCAAVFCLQWVVLTLAFFLKYCSVVQLEQQQEPGEEGTRTATAKVHTDPDHSSPSSYGPFKLQV